MTEAQFFRRPAGLTAAEIAALTGAEPRPGANLQRRITNIASIDRAGPFDLAFVDSAKFVHLLHSTGAGVCLVQARFADRAPSHVAALVAREPYRAFVTTARALFPDALWPSSLFAASGTRASTAIDPSARLEAGVTVDPGVVIGPGAEIGTGTVIGAQAAIGPQVRIGRDCAIGAGATVMHALIGNRVIVHPGAHIGQDGFGYVPGRSGHIKVPQVGRVIIQDDVEIGAGTTIDRGASRDTIVGEGTKIDNLVQIGHNVTIGRHCIIVAQVGISGSVTVDDYVMIGGQAGIGNNLRIGEGAQLGAQSGLIRDMPPAAKWAGTPARSAREVFREVSILKRLSREFARPGPERADKADPADDERK